MHPSEIAIRRAIKEDAGSLAALSEQLGYPTDPQLMFDRLAAILTKEDHIIFVATQQENVLGWIHGFYTLRVESDPFIEIGGLVVSEQVRGQGIGKLLVKKIEAWSFEKNCPALRVRSNTKRMEAHQFYENLGFKFIKDQKVFGKLSLL